LTLFLIGGLLISGCSDSNDSEEVFVSNEDLELAIDLSATDDTSQSIDDIVDNAYLEVDFDNLFKSDESKLTESQRYFSKCADIDKQITETGYLVTLDFGDGCTTKREDELSGKILMTITRNQEVKTVNIEYTFDNFHINGNKVEGEVQKFRARENDEGLPQSMVTKEITIIWEDETETEISSERTRVKIEGSDTWFWGDDVIEITGSSTHSNSTGTVREVTIIEPLIRSFACKFIISGIVKIESDNGTRTINYGDGTCDGVATVEKNGESREFQLRKKQRFSK
jgi:hypothetical protein